MPRPRARTPRQSARPPIPSCCGVRPNGMPPSPLARCSSCASSAAMPAALPPIPGIPPPIPPMPGIPPKPGTPPPARSPFRPLKPGTPPPPAARSGSTLAGLSAIMPPASIFTL
eukprot:scaffold53810_cov45-Phaeocystis_antarctica.AAC.1